MTSKDPSDLNIRLDQLLYYLRIFKTRGIATKAIEKGSCKVNNFLIKKKNKVIETGDVINIKNEKLIKQIKILKIPLRRGPFKEAIIHYKGPTKSSRRKLEKFMGRNF